MKGKVALVTGGSRGIGLAIVEELALKGADVGIIASSSKNLDEALEHLRKTYDTKFIGVTANVAEYKEVEEAVKVIEENLGSVDILVNNAGITKDTLFMRMTEENWDNVIDVNLKGVFNCTRVVYRSMIKKRYGRIINIASVVGIKGNIGQANYAASKAGIIGFTKTLAREGAAWNILSNAVAPGFIETQMTKNIPQNITEELLKTIPLGRFGKPEDVAKVVAFLAAEENQYITGQIISIDGGMAM